MTKLRSAARVLPIPVFDEIVEPIIYLCGIAGIPAVFAGQLSKFFITNEKSSIYRKIDMMFFLVGFRIENANTIMVNLGCFKEAVILQCRTGSALNFVRRQSIAVFVNQFVLCEHETVVNVVFLFPQSVFGLQGERLPIPEV